MNQVLRDRLTDQLKELEADVRVTGEKIDYTVRRQAEWREWQAQALAAAEELRALLGDES